MQPIHDLLQFRLAASVACSDGAASVHFAVGQKSEYSVSITGKQLRQRHKFKKKKEEESRISLLFLFLPIFIIILTSTEAECTYRQTQDSRTPGLMEIHTSVILKPPQKVLKYSSA